MNTEELYCPSNGSEGNWFTDNFCAKCRREKFHHAQNPNDEQCDILNRTLLLSVNDPGYPKEWTFDEYGGPTCTAHEQWDWIVDENGEITNEPPEPEDPNQLKIQFNNTTT